MSDDIREKSLAPVRQALNQAPKEASLFRWMPSLAFAECLTLATILISTVLFKRLGASNDFITYYTAWLYLPWALRPIIQRFMPPTLHSRGTLVMLEILIAIIIVCIAFSLSARADVQTLTILLGIVGLCGVMHSIESDRMYDKAAPHKVSHLYTIGYTLAFFLAMTVCHGLTVTFAGNLEVLTRTIRHSWSVAFYFLGCAYVLLAILHIFTLSKPDKRPLRLSDITEESRSLRKIIISFFSRKQGWLIAAFLMLYLLPEGLINQVSSLFLIDARHNGGLGLSPAEYGLVLGTIGMIGITTGSLLGSKLIRNNGLKYWIWPMTCAMTLPNTIYLYLSYDMTTNLAIICLCILFRYFALGFGLSAYVTFMIRSNKSGFSLSHYSLCASFIALPIMIPSWYSGTFQEDWGYRTFFLIASITGIITFIASLLFVIAENTLHDDIYQ